MCICVSVHACLYQSVCVCVCVCLMLACNHLNIHSLLIKLVSEPTHMLEMSINISLSLLCLHMTTAPLEPKWKKIFQVHQAYCCQGLPRGNEQVPLVRECVMAEGYSSECSNDTTSALKGD